MSDKPEDKPTEYRARPLPENQTVKEQLQTLQPEMRVVVESKNWLKSWTVIVNGALLIGASLIQVVDLLFGANLLEPLVKIFVTEPEQATQVITVITQVYTLVNLYLRAKTSAPITLRTDKKE